MKQFFQDGLEEKGINYYDENVKQVKKDRALFSATLRTRAKIISKIIRKYDLFGRLLDAGCGTGHLLYFIMKENKKRFESIEGVDFSVEACKNTSKLLGIKTYPCDLKNISKLGKKYDVIICSEVIEHIKEDEKILTNLRKLLNNNGKLILTVPYLKSNWGGFDEISGHLRRYDLNELENKLKKTGFIILDSFGWGNFFYSIYFSRFLKNSNPHKKSDCKWYKKLISILLTRIFLIDNLFINKEKGKTLFIIAKINLS